MQGEICCYSFLLPFYHAADGLAVTAGQTRVHTPDE